MPICDICSKPLERAEMKTFPGSKITAAAARGFVPRNLAAHSSFKAMSEVLGTSDAELWKGVVSQNRTADWGLCSDCAAELKSSGAGKSLWLVVFVLIGLGLAALIAVWSMN